MCVTRVQRSKRDPGFVPQIEPQTLIIGVRGGTFAAAGYFCCRCTDPKYFTWWLRQPAASKQPYF
jgi:hypothetical protein